jgi:nucleotide-binding universal stress UspA family protein
MPEFSKILCALDFTPISEAVVEAGKDLARMYSAELHLVHVVEGVDVSTIVSGTDYALAEKDVEAMERIGDNIRDAANARLAQLASELSEHGLRVEESTLLGEPFDDIIDYAETKGINLIIVGAHSKKPVKRLLIGSVSEKVTRKAHCSVLVLRD